MRSFGFEVTKRGWPDFICYGPSDSVVCIEVKRGAELKLKPSQLRIMEILSSAGVECLRWDPSSGFTNLDSLPVGRSVRERLGLTDEKRP